LFFQSEQYFSFTTNQPTVFFSQLIGTAEQGQKDTGPVRQELVGSIQASCYKAKAEVTISSWNIADWAFFSSHAFIACN
jgi:hypothetical protein